MTASGQSSSFQIGIEGEMTICTATEVRIDLMEALREHDEVEVDLGSIHEIDSAGLQLMLMAKRCPGKTVKFIRHSAAVLRMLELANLGSRLGDPLVFPACDLPATKKN